jgi:bla regulator protein blaR1
MANWSQSHFLQSLGWATLNSFWQMALLWCFYLAASHLLKLSPHRKYQFSVTAIVTGFSWFVLTFFFFFNRTPVSTIGWFDQGINASNSFLNSCLIAASVTYLGLLFFPAYKLFRNWQFVQRIKKTGIAKADLDYRLFVQKIAGHLGVTRKVAVFVSSLVTSPVTVGYLKPIILLPAAALSNLTTQQVEAVLLHELSHIRRFDYLVNFIISIIHTLLYFNPFVKLFMNAIETERENCCDELVLQFGYDKISYASALLTLEKISGKAQVLALAATGKNYLLNRIEKIVGMEKKRSFNARQVAAILVTLSFIVAFNSVMIIREKKQRDLAFSYNNFANPFALFSGVDESSPENSITPNPLQKDNRALVQNKSNPVLITGETTEVSILPEQTPYAMEGVMAVAQDEVDATLSSEQKAQVNSALVATKKVMTNLQWKEIEKQIGDVMTDRQKAMAREEYNREIESINWKNIEKNMKSQYEKVDWLQVNENLAQALTVMQIDSVHNNCVSVLSQLDKEIELNKSKVQSLIMPDASITDLQKARAELKTRIDTLKALRDKKIIRL